MAALVSRVPMYDSDTASWKPSALSASKPARRRVVPLARLP